MRADEFNEYNVPMPDSMKRKKKKKASSGYENIPDTRMPERAEAERRLQRQREQLETLEYVRKQELAREAEVRQQKLMRERELMAQQMQSGQTSEDTDAQPGKITVTSIQPDDFRQIQPFEAESEISDYDDDTPSFTYLRMKDGKISEQTVDDDYDDFEENDDEYRERILQSFDESDDEQDGDAQRKISQKVTPETATVTDIRQERKKEKTRKHLKRLIALLIVAILGLTAFLTSKWWIPKLEGILDKPHKTIVNDGKTEGGNFPLKISQSGISDITQCSDIMVTLDGNKVVFYKDDGSQLSAVPHNYGSPVLDVCAKKIVVYDNAGKSFQVLNKKGTVYSKKTDNPILMAKIGSNGYVAVVTQTEKYSAFVTVYDETGTEIYTWASGRRVVGICFNEDGKGCCISAIASSGGKINSVVYSVKFDSKQAVMTSSPIDSLVLQARLTKNGKYWVVGDDRFIVLDSNGNTLYTYEYSTSLVSFDLSDRYAAVYTDSVTRTHGIVTMFDCESDDDKPCLQKDLQGRPAKVQLDDSTVIVFTDKTVECYDSKGNQLATANITAGYVDIVYADKAVYLMGYREINKIKFET